MAFLNGFLWGFLLCFTFGPAFFAIIQVSVDSSYKKGAVMALGVVFADVILMFFAIFGTSLLPNIHNYDQIISIGGAILLFGMGLFSFLTKRNEIIYPQSKLGNFVYFFVKGAILNILNPANFLFVVSTSAYLKGAMKYSLNEIIIFFVASLCATLLAEILIAFYAWKLKKIVNAKTITIFNRVAGTVFILVALRMLWKQFL